MDLFTLRPCLIRVDEETLPADKICFSARAADRLTWKSTATLLQMSEIIIRYRKMTWPYSKCNAMRTSSNENKMKGKFLKRASVFILLIPALAIVSGRQAGAQALYQWPAPIVALYDCDFTGASVDSVSTSAALSTISSRIFKLVAEDASASGVVLMNLGTGDTSSDEIVAETRPNFYVPDSTADHDVDYIISGTVTGAPGSYVLSIVLQNSFTLQQAAEGTADFTSATASGMNSAVSQALSTILPLLGKIRSYEIGLRNSNSSISINPSVAVTASSASVALNGSTTVTLTVIDCDSMKLAGRQVNLTAVGGSISPQTVTTDNNGNATATFHAGGQDMVGYVQANLVNQSTVTGRPITAGGSGVVVVGSPDLSYIWKLDFNFTYQITSYSDTIATGDFGTSWGQTGGVSIATAYGSVLVDMNVYDGGFSYDVDSILFAFSKKFSHSITKISTISNDANCPSDPWEMKGKTENGSAMNDSVQIPSTIYLNNGGSISYETLITEYYNGNLSGYDWTRQNVSGNGGCQTQSSFQTVVLNSVVPILALYNQNMSGTTIVFNGPPANPNSIMVSVGYDSETISSDPVMGAQYQNSSMNYHAFMQPLTSLTDVRSAANYIPKSYALYQNYPKGYVAKEDELEV